MGKEEEEGLHLQTCSSKATRQRERRGDLNDLLSLVGGSDERARAECPKQSSRVPLPLPLLPPNADDDATGALLLRYTR